LQVLLTFYKKRLWSDVEALEYIRVYLDALLCITKLSLEDHLEQLEEVLRRLCDAGLKVNAAKIDILRT
jgi:hypothetical protein